MKIFPYNSTFSIQKNGEKISQSKNKKFKILSKQSFETVKRKTNQTLVSSYINSQSTQQKARNVSSFSFFTEKQIKPNISLNRNSNSEIEILIKKKKNFANCPQSQRIKVIPHCSRSKLEIHEDQQAYDNKFNIKSDQSDGAQRLNQMLNKNCKFDRKKYIYYRYRKKISPNKISHDLHQQFNPEQKEQSTISQKQFFSSRANYQLTCVDKIKLNSKSQQKINLIGILIARNNQFYEKGRTTSQIQQSKPPAASRNHQCLTARQLSRSQRRLSKLGKCGTKVFTQAIHFKPSLPRPQPHKKQLKQKQQPLNGWHEQEMQEHQQNLFQS